jgi:hypothetical protein
MKVGYGLVIQASNMQTVRQVQSPPHPSLYTLFCKEKAYKLDMKAVATFALLHKRTQLMIFSWYTY